MSNHQVTPKFEDSDNKRAEFVKKILGIDITFSKYTMQIIAACILGVMIMGGSLYYYNERKTGYAVPYVAGKVTDTSIIQQAMEDDYYKLSKLSELSKENYPVYVVMVNDKEEVMVKDEEEVKKIVEGIKEYYKSQEVQNGVEVLDIAIKDNIKIVNKEVNKLNLVDVKTAIDKLTSQKGVTIKYEVKSGDNLWQIARDNNMKIQEIADVNPELDAERLHIGQQLNLALSEPYLNIETTVKAVIEENIPYSTTYVSADNLYKGQTKVVESGHYGINRIEKSITRLNGKEIASAILASAIIKSPITQVLAKGTKALVGSGIFAWPTGGEITSGFGSRGREFHKGIDIGAPSGSPIYATDSGTVTRAGWYYGYGKLIIISHENGYETYYGHCSSISVSEGETVKKGQYIGAVGHTGQAYGNHLHFEVRLNGENQNPMKYLQ